MKNYLLLFSLLSFSCSTISIDREAKLTGECIVTAKHERDYIIFQDYNVTVSKMNKSNNSIEGFFTSKANLFQFIDKVKVLDNRLQSTEEKYIFICSLDSASYIIIE